MRRIERSTRFKRDYRRLIASGEGKQIGAGITEVLLLLAADTPLPGRYRDHALTGDLRGFRDCHVRPDVVLIYRKVGTDVLELARMDLTAISSETSRARGERIATCEGSATPCR